ncbi:MAG: BACON domain-containing protein [Candidatus Cryptobacteroides sp.]
MKIHKLTILGLAAALLASCNNEESKPANPQFELIETSLSIPATGGNAELEYTLTDPVEGASVNAESSTEWIHSFSYTDGKVLFVADANETYETRTADINVTYIYKGGFKKTWATVNQAATDTPVLSITGDPASIGYEGGDINASYTLTNPASDGKLTGISSESWIKTIRANEGTLSFTVEANKEKATRKAAISLTYTYGGGRSVEASLDVNQDAAPEDPVITITSQSTLDVPAEGTANLSISYEVKNPVAGGTVTSESKAAWIKISGKPADGSLGISVDENTSTQTRSGKVVLTYTYGATNKAISAEVTVNQAGAEITPTLIIYASGLTASSAGESKEVVIEIEDPASDGQVSAASDVDWISELSATTNNVKFTVAANTSTESRTGNVTVIYSYGKDKSVKESFTVTQSGNVIPSITLGSSSAEYSANCAEGPYNFTYTIENQVTGGTFSATSDSDWITITNAGSYGWVYYKVAENTAETARTGHITLSYNYGGSDVVSAEFTITQGAAAPAGDYTVTITADVSGNKCTNIKFSPSDKKHYFFTGSKGQADIVFQSDLDSNGQTLEDYIVAKVNSNCINFMMNSFFGATTPGLAVKYHCTNGNKTSSGFSEEFTAGGFSSLSKTGKAYIWAVQLDPDAADADKTNPYVYKDGKRVIFTLEVNIE